MQRHRLTTSSTSKTLIKVKLTMMNFGT